jgi:hypothetical protein
MAKPSSTGKSTDASIRALAASPRLPASRQRRLSQLMDKSRDSLLSPKESAELESMLEEIDRKSFWMLARVLVQKRTAGKHQPISK